MTHHSLRFAFFSTLMLAGCAAPPGEAEGTTSAPITDRCGTPAGDAIASEATTHRSTITPSLIDTSANRVIAGPLVEAHDIGPALYDLVVDAQYSVFIEYFYIQNDAWLAQQLVRALADMKNPDVPVYVMTNPSDPGESTLGGAGGYDTAAEARRVGELLNPTGRANVHFAAWNPDGFANLDFMHDKLVVVDGFRALVSDSNLEIKSDPPDQRPSNERGNGWFQLGIVVEGTVAMALEDEARAAWQRRAPDVVLPPVYTRKAEGSCTRMIALGRNAGAGEDESADRGYAAMLRNAQLSVNVLTPNLNDDGALQAIADATANADVRIVLPKAFDETEENYPLQGGGNEHNVGRLVSMAKNKCHLHVHWFVNDQGWQSDGNDDHASHAKFASVDSAIMILGSQNLDTQSWKHSRELGVAVDDWQTTQSFDRVFSAVFVRSTVAYEPDASCP